jgi:uncharacterized membrane protein YkvA (DUF1232 family)
MDEVNLGYGAATMLFGSRPFSVNHIHQSRSNTLHKTIGGGMRRIFRLWRLAGSDLRLLWAALRHPNRPIWLLPATLALGFFALEPFNFAIPVLGVVDDLFLLPLLLHGLAKIAAYVTTSPSTPRSRDDRVVSVQ